MVAKWVVNSIAERQENGAVIEEEEEAEFGDRGRNYLPRFMHRERLLQWSFICTQIGLTLLVSLLGFSLNDPIGWARASRCSAPSVLPRSPKAHTLLRLSGPTVHFFRGIHYLPSPVFRIYTPSVAIGILPLS